MFRNSTCDRTITGQHNRPFGISNMWETDQISEAEAHPEDSRRLHSKRDQGGTYLTLVAPTVAVSQASEETPLLSNGSTDGGNGTSDEIEDPGGSKWYGAADFDGFSWLRKPSIFWLLPAYSAHALALGATIVPKVNLVLDLVCRKYFANTGPFVSISPTEDNPQCHDPQIQELTTAFLLYISLIGGILAAVTSPKIGALSDRYGRKPLLAVISFGSLVEDIIIILAAKFPDTIHYSWILASAFIDGMCGSFIANWAVAHSYATDCTNPTKRAVTFGYFHACLFTGIALGPVVAAYVVKLSGNLISIFYFALGCHSLYFLGVTFVMPESLTSSRQLAARERYTLEKNTRSGNSSIFSIIKSNNIFVPLKVLYPTGEGSSLQLRINLLLLSVVDCILFGINTSVLNVIILYSEYQFKWTNYETNLFLSIVNSCRVFSLAIVLPVLTYVFRKRFNTGPRLKNNTEVDWRNSGSDKSELWIIHIGLVIELVGYSGSALANGGLLFLLSSALASFGGIVSPTLQSVLTKHVPHDRTGQLLGAMGLLHAIARIICPLFFSYLYMQTVDSRPQPLFMVLAVCFVVALISCYFVKPHVYLKETNTKLSTVHAEEPGGFDDDRISDEESTRI